MNTLLNRWLQKPPVGVMIDRGSPFCAGLTGYLRFSEGGGNSIDLVHGRVGTPFGAAWCKTPMGSAVQTDGTATYFAYPAGYDDTNYLPLTVEVWIAPMLATETAFDRFVQRSGSGGVGADNRQWSFRADAVTGNKFMCQMAGGGASPTLNLSDDRPWVVGRPHQLVGVCVGASAFSFYVNGRPASTTASDTASDGGVATVEFGRKTSTATNLTAAQFILYRTWKRALSQAEIIELYGHPFLTDLLPTNRRWFLPPPAAGGTANTQSLSGSITMSGALTKLVLKSFSPSWLMTAALSKLAAKPLSGSEAMTGALTKQDQKGLTGTEAMAGGTVTKVDGKAVSGTLTMSGSIAKAVSKALAGAITMTGTITKLILKPLADSIAMSGLLTTQKLKSLTLSGALAMSGLLTKAVSKAVSGASTMSGLLTKLTSKALSGLQSLAGILTSSKISGVQKATILLRCEALKGEPLRCQAAKIENTLAAVYRVPTRCQATKTINQTSAAQKTAALRTRAE